MGPVSLELKRELRPNAEVSATVHHGDRLEIVARRRRFALVRTRDGKEGWVDGRQLLRPDQMEELHALWEQASAMPSMGKATVYDKLNVHTKPNRQAPSFYQIPENGRVDVLWQILAPRVPYEDAGINSPAPKPQAKSKSKSKEAKKSGAVPPPPAPAPPPLPANWQELSKTNLPAADTDGKKKEESKNAVPLDEWTLVRTEDGKAGWALTRPLMLAIPDEVAQYAEGKRITSYFSLGEVQDGDTTKHHWLWTTISTRLSEHHFDSFRVFIYNTRKHRYETAYIERNIRGYFPAEVHTVKVTEGNRTFPVKGFSLIIEDKDGNLQKRSYAFQGYRVTLVNSIPWKLTDPLAPLERKLASGNAASPEQVGLFERLQRQVAEWKHKVLGN